MQFLMAMQHLRLDSVLDCEKEILVADRALSRDRLHAQYDKSKVVKHFAVRRAARRPSGLVGKLHIC